MPERHFLASPAASPDPTADTYILVTDIPRAAAQQFNTTQRITRDVTISGMTLIIDQESDTNQLFTSFDGAQDISTMTLAADRVVIRSPWTLHQTELTIFARELAFEAEGKIVTTPLDWDTKASPSDGTNPGDDGRDGEPGGTVTLNINLLTLPSNDATVRFETNGGKGQEPGLGDPGHGADAAIWDGTFFFDDDNNQVPMSSELTQDLSFVEFFITDNQIVAGTVFFTGFAEVTAVRQGDFGLRPGCPGTVGPTAATVHSAGRPGSGGKGGNILTLVPLSADNISLKAGLTPDPVLTPGGPTGKPNPCDTWTIAIQGSLPNKLDLEDTGKNGQILIANAQSVMGPSAPPGEDGHLIPIAPGANGFLHPAQLQTVVHFTEDAFLAGDRDTAAQLLSPYLDALESGVPVDASNVDLFQNIQTQMESLRHRLDSNLDYYFNPAGWTPELSLQANIHAFNEEVKEAVATLFLAFWTLKQTDRSKAAASTISASIAKLEQQRKDAIATLNSSEDRFEALTSLQADIANKIASVKTELTNLDAQLRAEAQGDVAAQQALNAVIKGFSLLTSVIPYGQPELGAVGNFIGSFGNIDPKTPPDFSTVGDQFTILMNDFLNQKLDDATTLLTTETTKTVTDANGNEPDPSETKEQAEQIKAVAANLGPSLKSFTQSLLNLGAPKDEVEAKLQELEANDPAFQSLAATLRDLNDQKEKFAQELNLAL